MTIFPLSSATNQTSAACCARNGTFIPFTCGYSILYGGADGVPIRWVDKGMTLHHVWHCYGGGAMTALKCMTVHSCFATGAGGKRIELFDRFG